VMNVAVIGVMVLVFVLVIVQWVRELREGR
jgi:hypothetical protein